VATAAGPIRHAIVQTRTGQFARTAQARALDLQTTRPSLRAVQSVKRLGRL
jgi:hypothetical protein